ncbi:MAG: superinfection immunity protein [Clostridia bacterium]|nr:superinfection immunity protein [Clostridia bacterium]
MGSEAGVAALIITIIAAIIGIAVALFIYFLPFIIAILRKHPQKVAIFFLNLLLGWSFVGWVVSLVWSFIKDKNGSGK